MNEYSVFGVNEVSTVTELIGIKRSSDILKSPGLGFLNALNMQYYGNIREFTNFFSA